MNILFGFEKCLINLIKKNRYENKYKGGLVFDRVNNIIEELELDFLEFVESDINKRKLLLPLKGRSQIKGLIWNLFTLKEYRNKISYNDYSKVIDILIDRLKETEK